MLNKTKSTFLQRATAVVLAAFTMCSGSMANASYIEPSEADEEETPIELVVGDTQDATEPESETVEGESETAVPSVEESKAESEEDEANPTRGLNIT